MSQLLLKQEVENIKNIELKSSSYFTIKHLTYFPSALRLHLMEVN